MQARPGGEVHLYHSVKGSTAAPGDGIRHRVTLDAGRSWSESTLVLSTRLQPGHIPAETIAGRFFPGLLGGGGAMVLVTDGGLGPIGHQRPGPAQPPAVRPLNSRTALYISVRFSSINYTGACGNDCAAGGRPDGPLHAYISRAAGDMLNFVAAAEPVLTVHPPIGTGGPANLAMGGKVIKRWYLSQRVQ